MFKSMFYVTSYLGASAAENGLVSFITMQTGMRSKTYRCTGREELEAERIYNRWGASTPPLLHGRIRY